MAQPTSDHRFWRGAPAWSGYATLSTDDAPEPAYNPRTQGWNVSLGRDGSDAKTDNRKTAPVGARDRVGYLETTPTTTVYKGQEAYRGDSYMDDTPPERSPPVRSPPLRQPR